MSINVVTLVGRVGGDPEMKYFDSGKVKCRLTLAVRKRSSKTDEPDWFELEIWGKTAEIAGNYVKRGSLIGIKGALKFDSWSDRNTGTNRTKPIINVEQLDLLGSKGDNKGGIDDYNSDNF
ncbi:single-strand-binding protein [Calothrix sp. NIES-4101]|nr:single-strand-binding protein [Calothrix sp. NIES-4101]